METAAREAERRAAAAAPPIRFVEAAGAGDADGFRRQDRTPSLPVVEEHGDRVHDRLRADEGRVIKAMRERYRSLPPATTFEAGGRYRSAPVWTTNRRHGSTSRSTRATAPNSPIPISESSPIAAMTRSVWNWAMARVIRYPRPA